MPGDHAVQTEFLPPPMIDDHPILDPVGPHLVSPHPRADLLAALLVAVACGSLLGMCLNPLPQNGVGLSSALVLRSRIDAHRDPGRNMRQRDTGIRFVTMLPARARAARDVLLYIVCLDRSLRRGRGIEHRDRYGAGVDAPALFMGRDVLPAVATRLLLQEPRNRDRRLDAECESTAFAVNGVGHTMPGEKGPINIGLPFHEMLGIQTAFTGTDLNRQHTSSP